MSFDVQIADQQAVLEIDPAVIRSAVQRVLADAQLKAANVSVAIVENRQIQQLNRNHLQHDYATDVLSFVFESGPEFVDGELIVNAEMARQIAEQLAAEPADELLLYVVHGALHLVGWNDQDEASQADMMLRETAILQALGLPAPRNRLTPMATLPDCAHLAAGDSPDHPSPDVERGTR